MYISILGKLLGIENLLSHAAISISKNRSMQSHVFKD